MHTHTARIFKGTGKLVQRNVRLALNDLDQEIHMRCQLADRAGSPTLTLWRKSTATPMLGNQTD